MAQLQQENRKLRSELEEQYKQAIKLADTIQMVHLARMKEAAKDMHHKITPASPPEDFKVRLLVCCVLFVIIYCEPSPRF